jgi:hypothetical protein
MRYLAPFAAPLAFVTLSMLPFGLGCSAPPAPDPGEKIGEAASPIFGGQPDTAHTAVVYVDLGGGASCTGTIIATCGSKAYVLTAAHCCATPVAQVILGDDAQGPGAVTLAAADTHADPEYSGPADHDFCLVQVVGAGASTPVIPVMKPEEDDLAPGATVDIVGYGVTESNDQNTQRRHVTDTLTEVTAHTFSYDQKSGGPCAGDSGGPALSKVAGGERVSGVTSQGDSDCVQKGQSSRVSWVVASFIAPYVGTCDSGGAGGGGGSNSAGVGGGTGSGNGGNGANGNGQSHGGCAIEPATGGEASLFATLGLAMAGVALRGRRRRSARVASAHGAGADRSKSRARRA